MRIVDNLSRQSRVRKAARGQGLVELALVFPVLIIMLSGLVEFGFLLNEYLSLMDAARNAARFSSDGLYSVIDSDHQCGTTRDFYRQTACMAIQELAQEQPNIQIKPLEEDDILVSVFSVAADSGVTNRYPVVAGEAGWSYALDLPNYGSRKRASEFTTAEVNARLDSMAPNTGLLLVEIYYSYEQKLNLPWIRWFLNDPLILHAYTFMPLVSAEPRDS